MLQKVFLWTDVSSCHNGLEAKGMYGEMIVKYEQGKIVLIRFQETIKPK